MEEAGEEVCDQEALHQARSPRAYADCLLGLAERLAPSRMENAVGAGVVPFRSALGRRIQGILDASRRSRPLTAWLRLMIAFGAVLAAVGGIFLVSAAAAPGEDSPPAATSPREGDKPATTAPAKEPSDVIGRVVDEQGRPVADVTLLAIHRTVYRLLASGVAISPGVAVTDKDGNYQMTGLGPATTYDVYIWREPSGKLVVPAIEGVDVGEGKTVRVPDIVLRPGGVITGVVTDRLTGMPLEGVVVAADGPHRPTGLTTGPYNVIVWDVSGQRVAAARENVKIQAGQTYRLPDFVLTRGATVEGTVKDKATGKPLPGVTVMCYGPYRPRSGIWPATAKTDEKGRYVMHVVAGRCTVSLNRHGYEEQTTKVNLKPGEKKSVSFRVKAEDFFSEDEAS